MSQPVVRCKFRCVQVQPCFFPENQQGKSVKFSAISQDGKWPSVEGASTESVPENAVFGKYTPSGELDVAILSPSADHFEVGKDYYINISPA